MVQRPRPAKTFSAAERWFFRKNEEARESRDRFLESADTVRFWLSDVSKTAFDELNFSYWDAYDAPACTFITWEIRRRYATALFFNGKPAEAAAVLKRAIEKLPADVVPHARRLCGSSEEQRISK